MALLSPPPKHQFFGDDGLPLSGGLVYTYEKDTTTPLATYTDSTGSVANANPIVLDGQGRASIWFQILPYSLVIHNSLGELQSCSGPVEFPQSATSGSDIAAWSDIVVYNFPDLVAGSDGYTYRCVGTNNLDDDPVTSTSGDWVNLSSVASPALTGTPTAPTAVAGTNTTQIATCAFVLANAERKITISAAVPILGNIRGGLITKTGDHQLTVAPCSCIDSTGLIPLYTATSKTIDGIASTANGIFYIFSVRLASDSSIEYRVYTTEAGVESDAEVNAFRLIGFWLNTSGGVLVNGWILDGFMEIDIADAPIVSTNPSGTPFTPSWATFFPVARVKQIGLWGKTGSGGTPIFSFYVTDSAGNPSRSLNISNNLTYGGSNGNNTEFLWVNPYQKIAGWQSQGVNVGSILAVAFKLLV